MRWLGVWLVIGMLGLCLLLMTAPVVQIVGVALYMTLVPGPLRSPAWLILAAIFAAPLAFIAVQLRESYRSVRGDAQPAIVGIARLDGED